VRIILIPGLGYNHRIFENLDLSYATVECLRWVDPKVNEPINDYSIRLLDQIEKLDEEVILIGHSFGGMVAQEIASVKKVRQIILLGSIKSRSEIPYYFKMVRPLHLHKLFTKEISINTLKYWGKNHGFETQATQSLFKSMLNEQTNTYLQWALHALSSWQEPTSNNAPLFHIHGTKDGTLPFRYIKNPDVVIENGTHIFMHKQGARTSEIIRHRLENSLT